MPNLKSKNVHNIDCVCISYTEEEGLFSFFIKILLLALIREWEDYTRNLKTGLLQLTKYTILVLLNPSAETTPCQKYPLP